MSVRMALAKLSAVAAGGALAVGGAVHVAEAPATASPQYRSDGKYVKGGKVQYVKETTAKRVVPRKVKRIRRVVEMTCAPGQTLVRPGEYGPQGGAATGIMAGAAAAE